MTTTGQLNTGSGDNSVHKDVKSVSNNEEEVDETDEVLGVLV